MTSAITGNYQQTCGNFGIDRPAHGLGCKVYLSGLWLAGMLPLFWGACAQDTRMSVYDFMEMEQPASMPPATQPVAATTEPADLTPQPWSDGPYRVGPDDVLTVVIAGLESIGLPNSYTVRCNQKGVIILPSIGAVAVRGMTLDELEVELQKRYSPEHIKNAQVAVQVTTYATIPVLVLGDVRQAAATVDSPTVQLRRDRTSVLQAVLAAGGPLDFGGQVTLIPARSPQQTEVFNMSDRADLVRAAKVGVVQAADIIIVDNRPNDAIYVLGLVNNPGPVPVPRAASISALQALGAAGGTMLAFEPKEATLMRRRANGELLRVKLNLNRLLQGQEPDIRLAAGDVLLVPHTMDTRFEEFVARNLVMRFGVDGTYNPWTDRYFWKNYRQQKDIYGGSDLFSSFGNLNQWTGGLNPVPSPTVTGQ